MYLQIINFNLNQMNFGEYEQLCSSISDKIASVGGLMAKFWLSDISNNVFGGVYIWESKTAMEEFSNTELYNSIATHPNLKNISSKCFDILDAPTRTTRGCYLEDYLERLKVLENTYKQA